jgi:maltose alpha-D-glucosyltransferase/alpha-amylase
MLGCDRQRIELAYIMFSLPGAPVIRYGDEIGMGDDLQLPERHCAQTPMQWSTEPEGGFTKNSKPVAPVISEGPYGYGHINIAAQRRDANSLLSCMERLIRMRKEAPEIGWGECAPIDTGDQGLLALRYDWRGNFVLVIHNFTPSRWRSI